MPPLFIPPLVAWALGTLGAAVVAKVLVKEWRRVNAHLHPNEPMTEAPRREKIPTLRRDPQSGIYRPD
jgi:hypothetical protein